MIEGARDNPNYDPSIDPRFMFEIILYPNPPGRSFLSILSNLSDRSIFSTLSYFSGFSDRSGLSDRSILSTSKLEDRGLLSDGGTIICLFDFIKLFSIYIPSSSGC